VAKRILASSTAEPYPTSTFPSNHQAQDGHRALCGASEGRARAAKPNGLMEEKDGKGHRTTQKQRSLVSSCSKGKVDKLPEVLFLDHLEPRVQTLT